MFEESDNSLLSIGHLSLKLLLLSLILLCKLVDLLLLRVKDFELFLATHTLSATLAWFVTKLILDLLDVAIVIVDHFTEISDFFVLLLNLCVVLLDTVHKSLSSLGEGQVQLIRLEFEIFFALQKSSFLFAQMLSSLLERILFKAVFSSLKPLSHFLKVLSLDTDLMRELVVLLLELFVLVALLRIQVVQAGLVCEVDIVDLLLITVELVLHVALLCKQGV